VKRQLQKSLNVKRSVCIGRHKTSVSLEDAFWKDIQEIAAIRNVLLSDLLATIDTGRHFGGLSSAIRLFVLDHYLWGLFVIALISGSGSFCRLRKAYKETADKENDWYEKPPRHANRKDGDYNSQSSN
jgi:predicted DNA-binding ribbon-helix-helix protein